MRRPSVRRLLVPVVLAALAVSAAPAAEADAAACRGARAAVTADTVPQARQAVRCLVNRVRARRGVPRLRDNPRLRAAATRHSLDMVVRDFFSHVSPGGGTLVNRVRRVRYVRPAFGWTVGENIGWGSGDLGSPVAMVRAWMRSPGHRANMLKATYREIGVGIAMGSPRGDGQGVTYTTNFGARR